MSPTCYLADYNLDGIFEDGSKELRGYGGALVLDSISKDDYFQQSPLNFLQAEVCLVSAARLHAAGWEDQNLLAQTADRLSSFGGSYHLNIRNPKEIENIIQSWDDFMANFKHFDEELFNRDEIKKLGQRISNSARAISQELSPNPNDSYATIVHGDYKAMNVFLPRNPHEDQALMIDFASTGVGLGISDVAMLIAHGISSKNLSEGGEFRLVDVYLSTLEKNGVSYPRDVAIRHYRLATIDYFRFVLGRFWRSATPETFEKRKNSPNTTLVNRNVDAALAFIIRTNEYLKLFEEESHVNSDGNIRTTSTM